jgi:putative ABC transport system permease protein
VRLGTILRAARRESRGARGQIFFFTSCLALGSLGVVGVTGLARSVRAAIAAQSKDLLGGDVWLRSREPFSAELLEGLERERAGGVRVCSVRTLQTMARETASGASRLVELKAVGPGFPFHGALVLEPAGTLDHLLDDSSVAIAGELAGALGIGPGAELALGAARFRVAALVLDEPGRLDPTFTAGPRVFSTLGGYERMRLEGVGSRISHGALLDLPESAGRASDWVNELYARLPAAHDVRIDDHEEAQPQVRFAARRVERYLGLVALLSLILGGVGVAEIVRAWIGTRIASIGILRVLGFTPRQVLVMYAGHVLALAVAGSLVGSVAGSFLPLLVPRLLPELLPSGLELAWAPLSILRGVGLGTLVAVAFSLPALAAVWRVPPVRVLRHEAEPLPPKRALAGVAFAALIGSVFVAAWVQSDELERASWFTLGVAVLLGLLALGARVLTRLARWTPREHLPPALVHGLAALARPGAGVLGAMVALGLGTLVVVTLLLVETRLSRRLTGALPPSGGSLFFLDLQTDQRADFERVLAAEGAGDVRVVPMVTGRLERVNGGRRDGRGRWWSREQRLTWQAELADDNRIVAGELWSDPEHLELSLEERFADNIGAELGSTLVFDIQGVSIELLVTSLRTVEWESFGINFFLVAEPGALDEVPHTLLAAANVAPEREQRVQDALLAACPNVSVIRVRSILDKVRHVLTRSALAVELLGAFTVLVGLVLLAGVASLAALRRVREVALWKVLGVTRAGVARLFALEFALVGLVAGLLGSAAAAALAWAFFEHVLELGSDVPWWTVPASALTAAALSALCGLAAWTRALQARPIETLRG